VRRVGVGGGGGGMGGCGCGGVENVFSNPVTRFWLKIWLYSHVI